MKKLSTQKIWLFAIGQLGWSMLSGLISNWLVYFYQPDQPAIDAGQTIFIPQGLAVLGIATIIGAITAFARVFDAITDPWIASLSDRCTLPSGRRIPFLKFASLPLAVSTLLVFWSPTGSVSWVNAGFLFLMLMCYYLSITAYCTPYNALISELGHDQKQRMDISTAISFTFIVGTAMAYVAPTIWGALEPSFGRITAIRITFAVFAAIAFVCMLVPVFSINEKEYVTTHPSEDSAFSSLAATFRNRDFRLFVASDIGYWIGLTMFQTGLPFFVTSLLRLNESMSTLFFVLMTALSVCCYPLVNALSRKTGKKKLLLAAFTMFSAAFAYTIFLGKVPGLPAVAQGIILTVIAAFPMACFGILPQAVVADIAEYDALESGKNREGMFFAARTFAFKLGQSLSLLIFTAVSTIGTGAGTGYRIVAGLSAIFCIIGGVLFAMFNEAKINAKLK